LDAENGASLSSIGVSFEFMGHNVRTSSDGRYLEDIEFPYPVYADPSRMLYKELGLISSLARPPKDEPPKSYVGSMASVIINSTLVCVAVLSFHGKNHLNGVCV
jgi:hypothetical protein